MAIPPLSGEESVGAPGTHARPPARTWSGERVRAEPELPRLVCVSNREPYAKETVGKGTRLARTTGGLVTALDAALRELNGLWVAGGSHAQRLEAPEDEHGRSYSIEQIGIEPREMDAYYAGFSNRVLWPLCHYFIGRVNFSESEWHEYDRVNRRFADQVVHALGEHAGEELVWVHDYHLMLVPRFVREKAPAARIGFFLHIPFPTFEVFRILPTRREILEGMLGADLVGFHTQSYQEAFVDCARRLLGARVDRAGVVEYRGHRTRTLALPIGIDVQRQQELASDPRVVSKAQRIHKTLAGDRMVLGVDRLDYSKGILERLHGFERLLELHPEHRGHTTLVQIAVPSRSRVEEYRQLKRACDEAVGRINGRYGDAEWEPVRYINRSFTAEELASYYRAADVALVTPLRDGLNLVAKEYVATRTDLGGALVLSEFAGCAEELPQAYFCNPFGPASIAEALHAALTDDRLERERRMQALAARVETNDVHRWARSFVQQLARDDR